MIRVVTSTLNQWVTGSNPVRETENQAVNIRLLAAFCLISNEFYEIECGNS